MIILCISEISDCITGGSFCVDTRETHCHLVVHVAVQMDNNTISICAVNASLVNGSSNINLPSRIATYFGAAVMMISFVIGILGNLWISFAILLKKALLKNINLFIMSLIVNDFMTYFTIVLFIICSYVAYRWNTGDILCQLNPEFTLLFTGFSLWHTALIAIHRYVVVCHNNCYRRIPKKAYDTFVLVAARAIPMACVFPEFSLHNSFYQPKLLRCILSPDQKFRIGYFTVTQILIPCTIVVLSYILVFTFVRRVNSNLSQNMNQTVSLRREIQITKMFGMVFLMIMVGFIPYTIMRYLDANNKLSADLYVLTTTVYGIATCSNPIVYGAMSTDVRKRCMSALRIIIRCCYNDCCFNCIKFEPVVNTSDPSDIVANNIVTEVNYQSTIVRKSIPESDGGDLNGTANQREFNGTSYESKLNETAEEDESSKQEGDLNGTASQCSLDLRKDVIFPQGNNNSELGEMV